MKQLAKRLALARAGIEYHTKELADARAELARTDAAKDVATIKEDLAVAKEWCAERALELRTAAETNYRETGDKHPCEGVNIRITKEFRGSTWEIYRVAQEVPKATIARDLSGYLEEKND